MCITRIHPGRAVLDYMQQATSYDYYDDNSCKLAIYIVPLGQSVLELKYIYKLPSRDSVSLMNAYGFRYVFKLYDYDNEYTMTNRYIFPFFGCLILAGYL